MARRLGVDEVPRGLPSQEANQIDQSGIGFSCRDTRGVGFRRLDGEMQGLRCGLPSPRQE